MPEKGTEKIAIYPRFPRRLVVCLAILHGSALLLLPLLPLPPGSGFILAGLVLFSLIHSWYRYLSPSGGLAVAAVEWGGDEDWTLFDRQGRVITAALYGSSFVHPWLIVLNFRIPGGKRCSLCLTADRVDREQLRRLRMRLNSLRGDYPAGR